MRGMSELFNAHGWKVVMEPATLPDGRVKNVARVGRADSVHILAFPTNETILVLREYRPYYADHVWMLPGGRADKETDITIAAHRELQEETGFRANHLELSSTTNHSESLMMSNHIFIATDLIHDPLKQDDDEMIEVHEFSLAEALDHILTSPIVHTPSAYALLRYMRENNF